MSLFSIVSSLAAIVSSFNEVCGVYLSYSLVLFLFDLPFAHLSWDLFHLMLIFLPPLCPFHVPDFPILAYQAFALILK